jgi:hypothetical protein
MGSLHLCPFLRPVYKVQGIDARVASCACMVHRVLFRCWNMSQGVMQGLEHIVKYKGQVQGSGVGARARVGARVGARARCWHKGCNTLLKTLELCFYHISPISEPFFLNLLAKWSRIQF